MTAIPKVKCPDCDRRMRYQPWATRPGGRLLCDCGRKIWVVRGEGNILLPEFERSPGLGAHGTPPPPPQELAKRLRVLLYFHCEPEDRDEPDHRGTRAHRPRRVGPQALAREPRVRRGRTSLPERSRL